MPLTINSAYPWGRSFDEYRRMFRLSDADLDRRILGCADGPAAFNAAMHRLGHRVVSCDPLYQFHPDEIRAWIDTIRPWLVAFDLALCSHFLFLYADELPAEFHLASVLELCRVAAEVRIFPLVDMKGRPSRHVGPILAELSRSGLRPTVERVPYEFQRGGDEMLKVRKAR